MPVPFRVIAMSGGLAALAAGAIVSPAIFPQAFAEEPQHKLVQTADQLFPKSADISGLKKFDFTIADSVSTEPLRTQTVSKIGFGQRTYVSIVTTATGTYSTDGLASPYVRYPGIDREWKRGRGGGRHFWMSSRTSDLGTWTSTVITHGSFTSITSHFTPSYNTRRRH
jgi:hypothetical protein